MSEFFQIERDGVVSEQNVANTDDDQNKLQGECSSISLVEFPTLLPENKIAAADGEGISGQDCVNESKTEEMETQKKPGDYFRLRLKYVRGGRFCLSLEYKSTNKKHSQCFVKVRFCLLKSRQKFEACLQDFCDGEKNALHNDIVSARRIDYFFRTPTKLKSLNVLLHIIKSSRSTVMCNQLHLLCIPPTKSKRNIPVYSRDVPACFYTAQTDLKDITIKHFYFDGLNKQLENRAACSESLILPFQSDIASKLKSFLKGKDIKLNERDWERFRYLCASLGLESISNSIISKNPQYIIREIVLPNCTD